MKIIKGVDAKDLKIRIEKEFMKSNKDAILIRNSDGFNMDMSYGGIYKGIMYIDGINSVISYIGALVKNIRLVCLEGFKIKDSHIGRLLELEDVLNSEGHKVFFIITKESENSEDTNTEVLTYDDYLNSKPRKMTCPNYKPITLTEMPCAQVSEGMELPVQFRGAHIEEITINLKGYYDTISEAISTVTDISSASGQPIPLPLLNTLYVSLGEALAQKSRQVRYESEEKIEEALKLPTLFKLSKMKEVRGYANEGVEVANMGGISILKNEELIILGEGVDPTYRSGKYYRVKTLLNPKIVCKIDQSLVDLVIE